MRSVFMALWCLCFMLIAVIGCDQEMKMMKPVVQDVMDPKPEDKPDTTVPVTQPDAEVGEADATMEPTVPEPDVEVPPMLVEETLVEPTDTEPVIPEPDVEVPPVAVEEMPDEPIDMVKEVMEEDDDPYTPLEGLIVSKNGRVQFLFASAGCVHIGGNVSFGGAKYATHNSKWQRRDDATSPWIDIPETEQEGLCGYSPPGPGQYRMVGEISINGVRGKYASENILTVE